jgi:mannose-6-phosphate isomerase-like protein (cupin superfamily)
MPVIHSDELDHGNLKGVDHGATISLILDHSESGHGPRLHRHPYDETWVVVEGNVTFQAGEDHMEAGSGDIVIVPPGAPHKFHQRRPGPIKARLRPRQPNV